ncbi:branched-chain amino acid ABC transporter substrate-binding protein [Mycoavidus sp. B2-EB]|uniref:branched-chain amino acid ABC transporter substrate-binding protein n=1 Tax=Mycoavidus sp. B2-EB TaxID=2651972 RepID=UPI001623ED6D|nr:branched-chain amino acid ABC transporter substrate-binding protein [Mycoavidus sp. B2-EB]BBO60418.1 branched chain amino acid ABC transporter substrate-binding protein [Mycoavidus sp. B2-EB]
MHNKFQKMLPISAAVMLSIALPVMAAEQVVKIGHVAPLTGSIAHLGKDNENGARLAIEEINAKGLVIGKKTVTLQLDAQDDGADPRQATQAAQKLVDDKVVGVVGHLNSGTSIPASRIYSDAGLVQISPSSTNPQYTQQGFKTTYRVVATDVQQGPALARYAQSAGLKKIVVVDDATAYGKGLADQFKKAAQDKEGLHVLLHEASNDKATDFRAILTKIKKLRPDAIFYGGMDATGGLFAWQAKQLQMTAKVLAGDGVCTENLVNLAKDATDNVICSQAGIALEKMPGGAEFEKKYLKRFETSIQIYAPFTYEAVYIIVEAMKRANSIDPAKILMEMPATNRVGVIGETRFDEKGDLKAPVISLYNYKNGKKTLLETVKM